MEQSNLIFINHNKKRNEYILIKENIRFCKHKFPCGYRKSILIKEDSKWMCFQL